MTVTVSPAEGSTVYPGDVITITGSTWNPTAYYYDGVYPAPGNLILNHSISGTTFTVQTATGAAWINAWYDNFSSAFHFVYGGDIRPVEAAFSGTPLTGKYPLTVAFTDSSLGSPTSWTWDFGDGSAYSSEQNPTHIYTAPGTYTVALTASKTGSSDTETKTGYVTVTYEPYDPKYTAKVTFRVIDAADDVGIPYAVVTCDGSAKTADRSGTVSFSLEKDSAYTYDVEAAHYTDITGASTGTITADTTIVAEMTASEGVPPVAEFIGSPRGGAPPTTVTFTDKSAKTPTSWDWDYGDGSSHGTTQNPTHRYDAVGTYTVTLIATNASGSDTMAKTGYIVIKSGGGPGPNPPTPPGPVVVVGQRVLVKHRPGMRPVAIPISGV